MTTTTTVAVPDGITGAPTNDLTPGRGVPATALTSTERRALRARAHALKPVIWVGDDGITPGVVAATDEALLHHELIKVRVPAGGDKLTTLRTLVAHTGAHLVGSIGHIGILFRPKP